MEPLSMPRATSRRISCFTRSCQCNETGAGMLHTRGSASGSIWIFVGGPAISCRGRCGHVLNVDAAK